MFFNGKKNIHIRNETGGTADTRIFHCDFNHFCVSSGGADWQADSGIDRHRNGGFLESGYYTRCIEEKCGRLSEYFYLQEKGSWRNSEEERRYLQYTNEFKKEDTNFCYWYKQNSVWRTNQPDTVPGEEFDSETVLTQAKMMGDYLIYDMEKKEFGTNIRRMEYYFFDSTNMQMYLPLENVILVIGVDTSLTAEDDLFDASVEYRKLHPWAKISVSAALISLLGWVLSLVYLTLASGHRENEDGICLNVVDRVKVEILTAAFFVTAGELMFLFSGIGKQEWDVSGLLVAAGTVSVLLDLLFLLFFLSMVRRMKAEVMWESSLLCWLVNGFRKLFSECTAALRGMAVFAGHLLVCFVFLAGSFYLDSWFCRVMLLVVSGLEAYLLLRMTVERRKIYEGVRQIAEGKTDMQIDTEELHGEAREFAEAINNIGSGLQQAVDDSIKNERMKADLITNVSHDIKTPLTSIINYVNLIQREEIENERIRGYVAVLDAKSQRLKQLAEDLVETSRITSGNVKLEIQDIDLVELVYQTGGEFNDKFEARELTIVTKFPKQAVMIEADGRHLYRVIENLYNNAAKYALEKTRIYVEIYEQEDAVVFSIKNISRQSLAAENGGAGDLTERFIRGDCARSTEGSGLGLSIAKSLTELMGGTFEISVDGDLFAAKITFWNRQKEGKE